MSIEAMEYVQVSSPHQHHPTCPHRFVHGWSAMKGVKREKTLPAHNSLLGIVETLEKPTSIYE
ncbi:MAG: hypothetical protein H0V70_01755 [Ktedonobacteraceae bacterium]|nr:hypothetical protein [Ktedonobacteraceae bacterium]